MNRKIIRWKPINNLCLFYKKIIELQKFANQLEKRGMKKVYCVVALLILTGCGTSRDYTPPADASGEQIFSTACTECHKPISASIAMVLSGNNANKDAIVKKFQTGSMRMPAFKNIQGESANRLADYILANSQVSK